MSLEFHFRNFETSTTYFAVNHAGCGGTPWLNGCPKCWWVQMADNPTGGTGSHYDGATTDPGTTVYAPADWVVHFGSWFKLITDGLKLVADLGLFIASEGEDEDALVDAIKDVFSVTEDAITAAAQAGSVDLSALAKSAGASLENTCESLGLDVATVKKVAQTAFGDDDWVLLAGAAYVSNVYDDNDNFNGGHGWVITASTPDETRHPLYKCNACFIHKGSLVFVFESSTREAFWPNR